MLGQLAASLPLPSFLCASSSRKKQNSPMWSGPPTLLCKCPPPERNPHMHEKTRLRVPRNKKGQDPRDGCVPPHPWSGSKWKGMRLVMPQTDTWHKTQDLLDMRWLQDVHLIPQTTHTEQATCMPPCEVTPLLLAQRMRWAVLHLQLHLPLQPTWALWTSPDNTKALGPTSSHNPTPTSSTTAVQC